MCVCAKQSSPQSHLLVSSVFWRVVLLFPPPPIPGMFGLGHMDFCHPLAILTAAAAEYATAATDYYTWGFAIITITSRTRAKKASKSIELTEKFFLKEIFWCTCLEYLKYLCICQSPYYFFLLLENSWHNWSASLFFFSKKSTFTA